MYNFTVGLVVSNAWINIPSFVANNVPLKLPFGIYKCLYTYVLCSFNLKNLINYFIWQDDKTWLYFISVVKTIKINQF